MKTALALLFGLVTCAMLIGIVRINPAEHTQAFIVLTILAPIMGVMGLTMSILAIRRLRLRRPAMVRLGCPSAQCRRFPAGSRLACFLRGGLDRAGTRVNR